MSEQNRDSRSAFAMWKILLLVFLLGIMALIVIPRQLVRSGPSDGNRCINNLRGLDGAANQFALEHHLTVGSPINFPDDLFPYLSRDGKKKMPVCPLGGVYSLKKIGDVPTCSLGTNVAQAHVLN